MASSNSSVVQSFSIALIVFVMLTFVLAVTTYLYFKKADENLKLMEAKQKEASDANTKRLEAEKNRRELVKDVLGFPEDMANSEILERKQDAIDDVYGSYLEEPTYEKLVEWLSSSIEKHYVSIKQEQADKDRFAAEKTQLEKKQAEELATLAASRQTAQDELEKLRNEKTAYEKDNTDQKNKLVAEREAANSQAKRLKLLGEEIAKAKPYLTADRLKNWPPDAAAEGGGGAADEGRDERRVALMLDEMRDRERTIVRLNQVLARLRVADPALQNTVLAATPKDDRVDGFDGRILSVNELDRTVLVACGTTTGLRAGLHFNVYPPNDPRPQLGSNKAVVEVVAIESDSLVRCRVRQDSIQDPIIPGDVVATSLWSPGTPLEVVIVGLVQLGGNPDADRSRLEQLVERIGGSVAKTLTTSTTMVVDAGVPQVKGAASEGQSSRKKMSEKEKKFRDDQLREAKQLGIRVMAIEPFLDSLGLQVESVRANRLPVPVDPQAAPARSENVAF
jgi:hypothetical protein